MKPIISPMSRIRHPKFFSMGNNSIVDDFCYFSTKIKIGICSHIASGCSIAGGVKYQFELGSFSSLSSGVKIWCTSDDYVNDLIIILPPGCNAIKNHLIKGNVILKDYTAVGANSVIMPDNLVSEGVAIGALSFVPSQFHFQPWSVYAGIPIRYIRPRNRKNVSSQLKKLKYFLAKR